MATASVNDLGIWDARIISTAEVFHTTWSLKHMIQTVSAGPSSLDRLVFAGSLRDHQGQRTWPQERATLFSGLHNAPRSSFRTVLPVPGCCLRCRQLTADWNWPYSPAIAPWTLQRDMYGRTSSAMFCATCWWRASVNLATRSGDDHGNGMLTVYAGLHVYSKYVIE